MKWPFKPIHRHEWTPTAIYEVTETGWKGQTCAVYSQVLFVCDKCGAVEQRRIEGHYTIDAWNRTIDKVKSARSEAHP